jgi:hypothetical protein
VHLSFMDVNCGDATNKATVRHGFRKIYFKHCVSCNNNTVHGPFRTWNKTMWIVINNVRGWERRKIEGGNGLEIWVVPISESHD